MARVNRIEKKGALSSLPMTIPLASAVVVDICIHLPVAFSCAHNFSYCIPTNGLTLTKLLYI